MAEERAGYKQGVRTRAVMGTVVETSDLKSYGIAFHGPRGRRTKPVAKTFENMLPNNRPSYQHHFENQWFSNRNSSEIKTWNLPPEQKQSSTDSKAGTNLINLMDVFYSTAQEAQQVDKEKQIADYQIKMLEEFLSTTASTSLQKSQTLTTEREKEFRNFFDKYEAAKLDVAKNTIELEKKETHSFHFYANHNIGTPKVLTPTLIEDNQDQDKIKVNEDLIDEVLLEKNLEKLRLCSQINLHNEVLSTDNLNPSYIDKSFFKHHCDVIDETIRNNINGAASKLDETTFHAPMVKNTSKINAICCNNCLLLMDEKCLETHTKIKGNICMVSNHKYLEAIKMDEKIFQKRSMLKNESEKLYLTPGPTLYEKSVTLPQIMKRLTERKETVEEQLNVRRRLILNPGSSNCNPALENVKIMLPVNQSAKTCEPLKKYVNLQSRSSSSSPLTYTTTSSCHQNPATFASTSINTQTPAAYAIGSVINHNVSEKTKDNREGSRFTSLEKLKALKQEQNLLRGPSPLNSTYSLRVLTPPQPLLDDCNKQRYIGYATSSLFRDFINGK